MLFAISSAGGITSSVVLSKDPHATKIRRFLFDMIADGTSESATKLRKRLMKKVCLDTETERIKRCMRTMQSHIFTYSG